MAARRTSGTDTDAVQSRFVSRLMTLDREERAQYIAELPRRQREGLRYYWRLWARPDQVWEPGPETFTVWLAGRGWGKTRTGAETVCRVARNRKLCGGVIGIAGRTSNDVSQTMIHGPGGIMECSPPGFRPRHLKSERLLVWPNGVRARLFSGDVAESFRGPNVGFLWAEELAHWADLANAWSTAKMILRHGAFPRCIVTTTPIGVSDIEKLVWEHDENDEPIVAANGDPQLDGFRVHHAARVVSGSTYDNAVNLPANYLLEVIGTHEGTATGPQEVHGKILRGVPSSPWRYDWIRRVEAMPCDAAQIVVAVDPKGKVKGTSAEIGIVVVALGVDGRIYFLADLSGPHSPEGAATVAAQALVAWDGSTLIFEDNISGDAGVAMMRAAMPDDLRTLAQIVRVTATVSKAERAAIVAPQWQAGTVYHVGPTRAWVQLERQMVGFDPRRPDAMPTDRMDAAGWAILHLRGNGTDRQQLRALGNAEAWAKIRARLQRGT